MEKISASNINEFANALRRHWPNLTNQEVSDTEGDYNLVKSLIFRKDPHYKGDCAHILDTLYREVGEGNPNSDDEYVGIRKIQKDSPDNQTNEWSAREDE